jgi:uncharacterized membrane protein (UPF0127 family)
LSQPRALNALRVVIAVLFIGGLLAFVVKGANNPPDPSFGTAAPVASSPLRTPLPGFEETALSVQTSDSTLEWCLLLALTQQAQNQGLMGVTDPTLGGYDGMLFRFPTDTDTPFWMKDTPMPLSIAFIDANGKIVSTADMDPCPAGTSSCPVYSPGGMYRDAIEVPQGNLERLGLTGDAMVTDEQTPCS